MIIMTDIYTEILETLIDMTSNLDKEIDKVKTVDELNKIADIIDAIDDVKDIIKTNQI